MTRKCVVCKETNYKNSYSFFSAPKDVETRKKWQEAIGVDEYVVNDETFVCSRHFKPGDIITHWVSGVPPHVVTIKYKKCRLRPGAVPNRDIISTTEQDIDQNDEYDGLEVNRHWDNDRNLDTFADDKAEAFLIPRTDNILTYMNVDIQNNSVHKLNDVNNGNADIEEYLTQTMEDNNKSLDEEPVDEMILDSQEHHQDFQILQDDIENDDDTIYIKDHDQSIVYVQDLNYQTDCKEESIDESFDTIQKVSDEFLTNEQSRDEDEIEELDEESLEMWEITNGETVVAHESEPEPSKAYEDPSMDTMDLLDAIEDDERVMLFEDLLEVYTEVRLPRGWSSMVISAGRSTTVIYACMSIGISSVPYVEKQVFLQSDMTLSCSAVGIALNPRLHNLLREGRQLKVHTLTDVEAFIEEFDQRTVCEGSLERTDFDSTFAYRHDSKLRHAACPIIINNGSSCCSKCSTLSLVANRRKMKKPPQTAESAELLQKDRTIYMLQKLVTKVTKRNQRYESVQNSPKSFLDILESLDLPEIQKLMIQECIKGDSTENTTNISETWIFLSLLIYIESPRIYRFLLLNKYMNLPEIKLIRRYLHQIKTDDQFYKLFQQTVKPFQYTELQDQEEPT